MKCPTIGEECWGEDCVRWDKAQGKCAYLVEREAQEAARGINQKILDEMVASTKAYTQMVDYYRLLWKISLSQLMRDPTIPQEIKDALEQSQDAETAEKLLKDAGLMS
ncbi:hypothetical protein ES703_30626 [subsurface metagenome]